MGFFDVVYVILDVSAFSVFFVLDVLIFLVMLIGCIPIWIAQQCGFHFKAPFDENSNHKSDVLLIRLPNEHGLYLTDSMADKVEKLAKDYCKRTAGRIRCMVSDTSLAEEFNSITKDPAEALYWKVHWKYPNHAIAGPEGRFHYHAILCVRREVDDDIEFDELHNSFLDLGFEIHTYESIREKVVEHEGDDRFERFAKLSFGRSTIWAMSTMQRLARAEALTVWGQGANYPLLKRNIYWTIKRPQNIPENQAIGFFSYESHDSLENMSFPVFTKHFYLWNQMCLLFSGFTALLYSGLSNEREYYSDTSASFWQLQQHMGVFYAILCLLHRAACSWRQAASNMSIVVRVRVFDYRDSENIKGTAPLQQNVEEY